MTASPVTEPIRVDHATRKQSNLMRLSLVPSLLDVASHNEAHGNFAVRLFEVGNTYEPVPGQELPHETSRLALLTPGDFFAAKGVVEAVVERLHIAEPFRWLPRDFETLRPGHSAVIEHRGTFVGCAGEISAVTASRLKLRGTYSILEISVDLLDALATLIPQQVSVPVFPGVARDLSLVVPMTVTWEAVQAAVLAVSDSTFETLTFLDSFRGGKLAPDEQSLHFALRFRHPERTLTGDEVDAAMTRIIDQCRSGLDATLRT